MAPGEETWGARPGSLQETIVDRAAMASRLKTCSALERPPGPMQRSCRGRAGAAGALVQHTTSLARSRPRLFRANTVGKKLPGYMKTPSGGP